MTYTRVESLYWRWLAHDDLAHNRESLAATLKLAELFLPSADYADIYPSP